MDRRVWGAAIVAVVLSAALVVPNLGGHRIVGSGSRVPVPDPPQVGQCLLGSVDGRRSALAYSQVVVAAARIGPCGEAGYGEVVSVTADWHSFPSTVVNRMGNPESLACQPPARGYLGWDGRTHPVSGAQAGIEPEPGPLVIGDPGVPGRTLGRWRPVTTAMVGLLGPNLSQYLSGQTWIACVVYPRVAPYAGTVRGGSAGSAAAAYGLCAGVEPGNVSCVQPHGTEIFGFTPADDADPAALDASCHELVVKASGMTDPTSAGALGVGVLVGGSFGDSMPSATPDTGPDDPAEPGAGEQGQAACVVSVAGDRLLVGSLAGIGDGPLPWA